MRTLLPILSLTLATTACTRARDDAAPPPPRRAEPTVVAPAATLPPPSTAPVAPSAASPPPATWSTIQAIASGSYAVAALIGADGVVEVSGATEDPVEGGRDTPRTTRRLCGAKAAAAVVEFARFVVEHARMTGDPVECDASFVQTPDPRFGAVAAVPSLRVVAKPGRSFRYAVCTSPGIAEYDVAMQLYFAPQPDGTLAIVGLLSTEVGSALNDDDLGVLADQLTTSSRCPS